MSINGLKSIFLPMYEFKSSKCKASAFYYDIYIFCKTRTFFRGSPVMQKVACKFGGLRSSAHFGHHQMLAKQLYIHIDSISLS